MPLTAFVRARSTFAGWSKRLAGAMLLLSASNTGEDKHNAQPASSRRLHAHGAHPLPRRRTRRQRRRRI